MTLELRTNCLSKLTEYLERSRFLLRSLLSEEYELDDDDSLELESLEPLELKMLELDLPELERVLERETRGCGSLSMGFRPTFISTSTWGCSVPSPDTLLGALFDILL